MFREEIASLENSIEEDRQEIEQMANTKEEKRAELKRFQTKVAEANVTFEHIGYK